MCYEEADYQAEQQAYAEAEAQANNEQEYAMYLQSLLDDDNYELWALHYCTDKLSGGNYKKEYLPALKVLHKLLDEKEKIGGNESITHPSLPF